MMRQIPSIVLPTLVNQTLTAGFTETIADAVQHVSDAFASWAVQEKIAYIYAVAVAAPAALNVWVELAPFNLAASYVALGVPTVIAVTGSALIQWTTHAEFTRIVAQCPAWAAGSWVVTIIYEAKPL